MDVQPGLCQTWSETQIVGFLMQRFCVIPVQGHLCCLLASMQVTTDKGQGLGPRPLGLREIDGLHVPPGKAYTLPTDHLITGKPLRSQPAQERWFHIKSCMHLSFSGLLGWLLIFSSTFCMS